MVTRIELELAVSLMTEGQSSLGAESCPLNQALGRTLSTDVTATMDQPSFDRSPLDGYALRSADSVGAGPEHPIVLNVVDTVYAGDVAQVPVGPGQAVRIMTGAMLPEGCDCVLRQEDTDMGFPNVSIRRSLHPDENFVHRGTDYRAGTVLLPGGTVLDASACWPVRESARLTSGGGPAWVSCPRETRCPIPMFTPSRPEKYTMPT